MYDENELRNFQHPDSGSLMCTHSLCTVLCWNNILMSSREARTGKQALHMKDQAEEAFRQQPNSRSTHVGLTSHLKKHAHNQPPTDALHTTTLHTTTLLHHQTIQAQNTTTKRWSQGEVVVEGWMQKKRHLYKGGPAIYSAPLTEVNVS